MHDQNETSTPVRDDHEAHEARRRRLLRLGAAAPMVLTLRPGASFGASMLCTQRTLDAADQARADNAQQLAASVDADEWVRAQVDIVELQRNDLSAENLEDARIEGEYVLASDGTKYWRVDGGNSGLGPMVASAKSTPRVSAGSGDLIGKDVPVGVEYNVSDVTATTIEKRWALIKVDRDTGEPLGYSWEPQAMNGIAVSNGCFASLHAGVARYDGDFGGIGAYVRRVLGLG